MLNSVAFPFSVWNVALWAGMEVAEFHQLIPVICNWPITGKEEQSQRIMDSLFQQVKNIHKCHQFLQFSIL